MLRLLPVPPPPPLPLDARPPPGGRAAASFSPAQTSSPARSRSSPAHECLLLLRLLLLRRSPSLLVPPPLRAPHAQPPPRVARPMCLSFASEERGSVYLHLLSPQKELCLPFCIICWRRKWRGTVAWRTGVSLSGQNQSHVDTFRSQSTILWTVRSRQSDGQYSIDNHLTRRTAPRTNPVEWIWREGVGGSVVPPFFPASLSPSPPTSDL
jgi:hypothetical protein